MNAMKNTTRLPGLLWFLCSVTGGFGLMYVRSNLIVTGDAAATAGNVVAHESLFRAAIVSSLLSQLLLFFFGLAVYHLFKEFHKVLATVLLTSIMMTVALAVMNQINNLGVLLVLGRPEYLKVFSPEQLNAMAMVFFRLSNSGQGLLELFWTPYFFALGLLSIKAKFLPKIMGVLLIAASAGFAANVYTKFLIPHFYPEQFTQLAMTLGGLGAMPSILWLLIKGAKVAPLDEPAS
jgi:uncharacterized protein DUF4386